MRKGDLMIDNCLILMVKCPFHGKVKSRLSKGIGLENAREFYWRSGLDILDTIAGHDFDVKIGFFPSSDSECIVDWLGKEYELIPQTGMDLGEKQISLLQAGFDLGYNNVCVIISDSPDIPSRNILSAFDRLSNSDCVIAPSPDGGYYLIGFTKNMFKMEPFQNMKWSHGEVTKELESRLNLQNINWIEIDEWPDIDEIADLEAFIKRNPEGTGPRRTMEFLRGLDLQ